MRYNYSFFRSSCHPFLLCRSSCHWSSCESDVDSR